ncbi:hsp70-like protein [Protomyces lactucae-debilis]|uniref:Hsp70-like protein n=1 Tax=Protomyces lactucae-debilis TaxID=2754530 RepID=A0A1Y2ERH5_PROLT|nr:hsp70-like protein [Protomyces lactucae-debilis]ORY74127.1 hsp70-like protein [Protomyces lactucae-debilis]
MSVVGIDLGSATTVIAVARNRGIDVITNEVSNRATPTLVGFGPKARTLGEPAKTNEISNFRNTVGSLKRIIGRRFDDPEIQEIESKYISSELIDIDGGVGVKVNYLGEESIFSSVQLTAAFLTKIKETATAELKMPCSDVVISVPGWFTDVQRKAVLDAADIAGLHALRLMNDTTASALGYGITKTDLPEDKPRYLAICDIGHSNYSVAIVAYKKGQLNVKSTAYDRHFGGRDFDRALVDHFAKEFSAKYKLDLQSNPKAMFRLTAAVEKMKKILSANLQAPISVESIMNDVDVSAMMKRDELEALVQPLLDRATEPLERALADAGLTIEDIEAVEMVGGCTRVPAVKERIAAFFGKTLSFTLNQDEAVARGCAFGCAILSPVLRVRDFAVHDLTPYGIEFSWDKSPEIKDEDPELLVFNKNNVVPCTKIMTFYRKEDFTLTAKYADASALPGKTQPWIGTYTIKGVKPNSEGDFSIVKVKSRLDLHGTLIVQEAYVVAEKEVEELIPESELPPVEEKPKSADSEMPDADADAEVEEPPKPKTRLVKKMLRTDDKLTVVSASGSLDAQTKARFQEQEVQMTMTDRIVLETEDRKNALEEHIYSVRSKLEDEWAPFASEQEKEKLNKALMEVEDWLYDEGEDAKKAKYVAKLEDLQRLAGPIRGRYFEEENKRIEAERAARELADKKIGKKSQGEERPAVPTAEQVNVETKKVELEAKDYDLKDAENI